MIFKCKICGGSLDVAENSKIITCDYCGTKQTLPKLESNKIANLYDRANHFRRNNEYDKAEAIYEMILNEDSKDAETYWSLLLCQYGVEYVKDPKTNVYIPTCNRTKNSSILADENYKLALKYADEEQKVLYETEAEKINQIQKGILEISKKEEPFDVFICYKETDDEGNRTQDSVIAQDLYYQLQKEGLKVFFAKITLENKIGESYEPYIFAALNSAKVMLVIGSKKEYFEAPWVKNEWSRYLALIKKGEKKTLIPCFKDMDAYSLPEEFSYLQSQDMSKIGFEQDLIHGIKKLVQTEPQKKTKSKMPLIMGAIMIAVIVILVFVAIVIEKTKNTQAEDANSKMSKIVREDIGAPNGCTFSITIDELKNKLLDSLKGTEYEGYITSKEYGIDEGILGIGFNYNLEEGYIIGIEIYGYGGYVTSIACTPARMGSGDVVQLSLPINLYEKAKKILGSETEEWKQLEKSGSITEEITDIYTGEKVTDEGFMAGMREDLYLVKK